MNIPHSVVISMYMPDLVMSMEDYVSFMQILGRSEVFIQEYGQEDVRIQSLNGKSATTRFIDERAYRMAVKEGVNHESRMREQHAKINAIKRSAEST